MDSFIWGLGRTAGNRTWKQVEKSLAKKVVDPNTNFRKQIQKFQLPGTPKSAIQKIWTLIDGFIEEYAEDKSMFQSTYKSGDIDFIQRKLDRIEMMKMNSEEFDNFEYIKNVWTNLKK